MINIKNIVLVSLLVVLIQVDTKAGEIEGALKYHGNQKVTLYGFHGLEPIELAQAMLNDTGYFSLNYPADYKGMGYLQFKEKEQFLLVLNDPYIKIKGTHIQETDNMVVRSRENELYEQYGREHNIREQALAGWKYLWPQYEVINTSPEVKNIIVDEIQRLQQEDAEFLRNLVPSSYVSWYLPLRKHIQDVSVIAKRDVERIPESIQAFRNINFSDQRMYNSGLLSDLIQSHYWLLENTGPSLDSAYIEMNRSTDYLMLNLEGHDQLINEVTDFLFDYLEKRSLFTASEYLALKMLTQSSCTLNDDLANQLETYRAMKAGNIAPDIKLDGVVMQAGSELTTSGPLSQMNNEYTLVVFGASWCPKCSKEIPQIKKYYNKWKSKGMEVVFVSLDTDEEEYREFVKGFPWISGCDMKSWESQIVKDYYIFSTPTMFLLNKELEILVRPISIEQVDAWMEYKL